MPITLENVEFTYMAKTPYERKALQGVSLTVDKGDCLLYTSPSPRD